MATSPQVTVVGMEKLRARLAAMAKRIPNEVARALFAEAQVEMTEAKRRVPVDTGALRASGHVGNPQVVWRDITVRLAFGGPAAPYAIKVHEDLSAYHKTGQAKFLESVILESAPYMAKRVAKRIELTRLAG